jgi:hypothetical protein
MVTTLCCSHHGLIDHDAYGDSNNYSHAHSNDVGEKIRAKAFPESSRIGIDAVPHACDYSRCHNQNAEDYIFLQKRTLYPPESGVI